MRVRVGMTVVLFGAALMFAGCGGDNLELCDGCPTPIPEPTLTPTSTAPTPTSTPTSTPASLIRRTPSISAAAPSD